MLPKKQKYGAQVDTSAPIITFSSTHPKIVVSGLREAIIAGIENYATNHYSVENCCLTDYIEKAICHLIVDKSTAKSEL